MSAPSKRRRSLKPDFRTDRRARARSDPGDASVAERQSQTPVLRVEGGRVWHDAGLIDFTLYPGEIVGITGLDGQGQTDFVRCLAGVQTLVAGRISVIDAKNSEDVNDLRSARDNAVTYVSGDRKK